MPKNNLREAPRDVLDQMICADAHLRCFFLPSQYMSVNKRQRQQKTLLRHTVTYAKKNPNTCLETYPKLTQLVFNISWHLRELFEALLRRQKAKLVYDCIQQLIEPPRWSALRRFSVVSSAKKKQIYWFMESDSTVFLFIAI